MDIIVHGQPAPQGSKRHVGRGIMIESSKAVKPWREDVRAEALKDPTRFRGPVEITMVFTLPKPRSAPKRRRTWPDKRPDLDKLQRSTLDALVSAGTIDDDARVVRLTAEKVFPNESPGALDAPGARIRIEPMEGKTLAEIFLEDEQRKGETEWHPVPKSI